MTYKEHLIFAATRRDAGGCFLATVIEMIIAEDRSLQSSDVYGAMVRNRAKLAYNSVAGWLESNGPMPTSPDALKKWGEDI